MKVYSCHNLNCRLLQLSIFMQSLIWPIFKKNLVSKFQFIHEDILSGFLAPSNMICLDTHISRLMCPLVEKLDASTFLLRVKPCR